MSCVAGTEWREIRLPFEAYWLMQPLDVQHLRPLGLFTIGRAFHADLAVRAIGPHG